MWEPTSGWLVDAMSNAIIFAPRSIRSLSIEAPSSPRRGLIYVGLAAVMGGRNFLR
jgi:hypothetical protein